MTVRDPTCLEGEPEANRPAARPAFPRAEPDAVEEQRFRAGVENLCMLR